MTATNQELFAQFNEDRKRLAGQFHELVAIIGNQVFNGKIDASQTNVIEQINRQSTFVEAEKNLLRNLYFFASNLMESRFFLGVLGRFKAGKSTLLNAIAGEDISPVNTRISTGVLNFIQYAAEEKCIVVYDSGEQKEIEAEQKIEFIDFRHNPDNEKGVHSVRYASPRLKNLQKEIIFVDTPGLEAVNSVHEEITLNFVTQCHAAVVVSTYPPFGESELRFYERIKKSINNIFLVQNLPTDKLSDWVPLEAQTLEHLYKLGFYEVDTAKYDKDSLAETLRTIGDKYDKKALDRFKKVHNIHLYSLCALGAYRAIHDGEGNLEETRFLEFKNNLYEFLAQHKGQKMIETYLLKGRLILSELVEMVETRHELLQKSVEELDRQIEEQRHKHQKMTSFVEVTVDRTKLSLLEAFKGIKKQVMDEDLAKMMEDMRKTYGDTNVFRLRKKQIKEIKTRIGEFNRILAQRHQEYLDKVRTIIEESQQTIATELENHSLFRPVEISSTCVPAQMGEISGVGYIDYSVEFAIRGSMIYIFGTISNWTIYFILAFFVGNASLVAFLVGGIIGLGLSFPLEKRCAPFINKVKEFIGRFAHKPTAEIFNNFRKNVRERLDELETTVVDQVIEEFRQQVLKATRNSFELFQKTLRQLKEKKERGSEQSECEKLEGILEQLKQIEIHFSGLEGKTEEAKKLQGMLKGIKGFMRKFTD